ncbi:MAG: aldo/keto reductase [Thermoplasmatales archaeon A-plasma]|jgi:Aldo/keto reductases, related to diketogulonate reductase|nr:MAG: aldo/keto reductase [Thermoplasmatales archaeon A-plasma]
MELKDRGKIRHIGVSNFDEELLEDAIAFAGKGNIEANEIEYNYGNRREVQGILSFCKRRGIAVIAYSPLSRGAYARTSKVREIAEKYGISDLQVGLRFVMENALPIPKASSPGHIDELVETAGIKLSREDLVYLEE